MQKARSRGEFDADDETTRKLRAKAQQQEEATLEQKLLQKIQQEPQNLPPTWNFPNSTSTTNVTRTAKSCWPRRTRSPTATRTSAKSGKTPNCGTCGRGSVWPRTGGQEEAAGGVFAKEVEVYKNRVQRYPNNLVFKFELGYRYMLTKQYADAIRELQVAKNDPRRKGACMLVLGQCFEHIKQYRLAMNHYESAIQEIPTATPTIRSGPCTGRAGWRWP